MDEQTPVKVVLRRWRDGDLIALMPEEPADEWGRTISSYMHVGQHGAAAYEHVISQTRPVLWWDQDVLDFLDELKRIGYDVDVRQRCTPEMRAAREAAAKALREVLTPA